ncbi:hypothetical protein Pan216_09240 [Planctomycetes bacterium Pan216]|uniref:YdbS-like PH domain-containing protein n=1 Tax=Kolteria novifilia TaxID=2527975 RepID=A0A518AZA6_9BACT|nr:hypothetical protein Pan216_09240 [Planctomycetes bacterium Pan216]
MADETTASETPSPTPFGPERTITAYWATLGESNAANSVANALPLGLGLLIYVPAYLLKGLNVFSCIRYTLTNRRLRVDRGIQRRTVQSVPLEEIEEIRLANELEFTRTGDLEIVSQGRVVLRMVGIQDPRPARQTILDAVEARIQIGRIVERQAKARAMASA